MKNHLIKMFIFFKKINQYIIYKTLLKRRFRDINFNL